MPMSEEHKEILRKNRTSLVENMECDPLYSHLIEKGLINSRDEQECRAESSTNRQSELILDKIQKKGANAYDLFKECLKHSGHGSIVDEILNPKEKEVFGAAPSHVKSPGDDAAAAVPKTVDVKRTNNRNVIISDVSDDGTSITLTNVEYTDHIENKLGLPAWVTPKITVEGTVHVGTGNMSGWIIQQCSGKKVVLKKFTLNKHFYSHDGFQVKLLKGIGANKFSKGDQSVVGECFTGLDNWTIAENITTELINEKGSGVIATHTKKTIYHL